MDEQRCSAPSSLQNQGTPTTQHKDHPMADKCDKLSASLNHARTDQQQQVGCHAAQYTAYSFTNTPTFRLTCILLNSHG